MPGTPGQPLLDGARIVADRTGTQEETLEHA
jgi:hypothetical protein